MYQGILRLILAMIVVVFHFFTTGPMPGRIAVFAFYLISGYLVTRIINERYTGADGLARFALNRFLRLYPTYLCVFVFTVILMYGLSVQGKLADLAADGFAFPNSLDSWIRQFTIVGLTNWQGGLYPVRIVPVGFSLAVEILHYVLIALLLGRSALATTLWWAAGLAIAVWMTIHDDFIGAYVTYWGPTIMFASGAALYHGQAVIDRIPRLQTHALQLAVGFTVLLVLYCFGPTLIAGLRIAFGATVSEVRQEFGHPSIAMLYLSIPVTALSFMFSLRVTPVKSGSIWRGPAMKKFSDFCGDLSYPLFLSHVPIHLLLSSILPTVSPTITYLGAIAASLVISAVLVLAIEVPMKSVRARVRPRGTIRTSEIPAPALT